MKTFLHLLLGGVIGGLLVAYLGTNGFMGKYSFITQGGGSSITNCGDNLIDKPIEECDNGRRNNGVVCNAAPNTSCLYCSNECKTVKVSGTGISGAGILNKKKGPSNIGQTNTKFCGGDLTTDIGFQDYIQQNNPRSRNEAQKKANEYSKNSGISFCKNGYSVSDFGFDSYKSGPWNGTIRWFCKQDNRNNTGTPRADSVCRFTW